ncbi:MAG: orotate phosphoribosyltransferase [Clostridiales bacterium]|nr:orotate phosphoribosyltransferase [Clostridiales bacterium]
MEGRAYELFSKADRNIFIKVIPGHFATKHSHVNYCVDMTAVKSQLYEAKAAAKLLTARFAGTPVDTIISLDRMKMVGSFMAEELAHTQMSKNQNIAVITPEITNGKMLLRDNFLPYVKYRHVLLLTASATTGKDVNSVVEGIRFYGGTPVGAAMVFGDKFDCGVQTVKLFGIDDIPDYCSYAPVDCPLCRSGVKVDAVVNSYGYSKFV